MTTCFPGSSDGKESAFNTGDPGSISGSGRSPGEGNANPLQYSCLENSTDRGAWRATVHGITELDIADNVYMLIYLFIFSLELRCQSLFS